MQRIRLTLSEWRYTNMCIFLNALQPCDTKFCSYKFIKNVRYFSFFKKNNSIFKNESERAS